MAIEETSSSTSFPVKNGNISMDRAFSDDSNFQHNITRVLVEELKPLLPLNSIPHCVAPRASRAEPARGGAPSALGATAAKG
jgi:hypothetical protein